jgi:putative membrane protein insertion efficiency factor
VKARNRGLLIFHGMIRSMKSMKRRRLILGLLAAACVCTWILIGGDSGVEDGYSSGQAEGYVLGYRPEGLPDRLVRVYRNVVSDRDGARCLFYPTCSAYYLDALEVYGFFPATLMLVDRVLYRENARAFEHYPVLKESGRLFDPVGRADAAYTREDVR